ncbi:hypothetical protein VCRA2122O265_510006 [Vibrio crassostreae]|nr:hypothetical protein VCRA2118O239_470003 [Vibrio crassostreae]CAK2194440.1 hypothetical protein VCRA2110O173_600006 [Vibrio crassostreae]CAK2194924.1 hypothetical protein VCRA2113O207_600003 [Vibrio crassostreae]CAK2366296.1 hypothetical protein VCRA2113O217_450003 [Vibrio crassostreae]CAK2515130.1 hypothetical protein VCRA2119O243_470006 [Vibrio crassostreae]
MHVVEFKCDINTKLIGLYTVKYTVSMIDNSKYYTRCFLNSTVSYIPHQL